MHIIISVYFKYCTTAELNEISLALMDLELTIISNNKQIHNSLYRTITIGYKVMSKYKENEANVTNKYYDIISQTDDNLY